MSEGREVMITLSDAVIAKIQRNDVRDAFALRLTVDIPGGGENDLADMREKMSRLETLLKAEMRKSAEYYAIAGARNDALTRTRQLIREAMSLVANSEDNAATVALRAALNIPYQAAHE